MKSGFFENIRKRASETARAKRDAARGAEVLKSGEAERPRVKKEGTGSAKKKENAKMTLMKQKIAPDRQAELRAILKAPRLTEKSTMLTSNNNTVVFEVLPFATKRDVRDAVEFMYGVRVKGVRVLRSKSVRRRFGAVVGKTSRAKKAMVSVDSRDRIDLFDQTV